MLLTGTWKRFALMQHGEPVMSPCDHPSFVGGEGHVVAKALDATVTVRTVVGVDAEAGSMKLQLLRPVVKHLRA